MVCSEELPAQWQNYPLKTRMEMMHGRSTLDPDDVRKSVIARWADEGEKWLNEQFKGNGLEFHTSWDTASTTITLEVFKLEVVRNKAGGEVANYPKRLLSETCAAQNFVTRLMVTKIMMVM